MGRIMNNYRHEIYILIITLVIILLVGCDGEKTTHSRVVLCSRLVMIPPNVYLHSALVVLPAPLPNFPRAVITVPKGYRALNVSLNATHRLGTIAHPTIDGGILNTVDGVTIIDVQPQAARASKIPNIPAEVDSIPSEEYSDARLEKVLQHAASDGKLAYVLKASREQHLPARVALIPMLESDYHTTVTSSKGAAGAWQLMPSVAQDYGITPQQRYQFTTSTQVALQVLQNLHQHFHSWDLAFAAYNAGSARVTQALLRHPQAHTLTELQLPPETQTYLARLNQLTTTLLRRE